MKLVLCFALSLLSSASAFTSSGFSKASTLTQVQETKADLEAIATELNPFVKFYDPLNLAEAEFWGTSNEATIGFLRHAEIKHSRVAMFAFVGYIVHANGIKFPWAMQMDGTPFPSETNPPALWDAISDEAKWQIFAVIGFLEFMSELSTDTHKHYMAGGKPGDFPDFSDAPLPHPVPFNFYDPFRIAAKQTEEQKKKRLITELNNGRAAMLGIMGFLSAQTIPGSVPLLEGVVPSYSGEVMAPFTENVIGSPFGL